MITRSVVFGTAAIVGVATVAAAQSLESRISAARGSVAFEYETRPNVCGDGKNINISDDRDDRRSWRCQFGPARVVLRRDGDRVADLRLTVGGRAERADTELGDVPPAEAARYLLAIAPRLNGRSADHAVTGAEIADGVVVWPRLLQIARDEDASESARKSAVFWVSQEASAAATAGLDSIASDDDTTLSVRKDAVFFLAQRPNGEGIPALVRVVESSKSVSLRKDAIFFLAQSRDPRALQLFEKLLAGR